VGSVKKFTIYDFRFTPSWFDRLGSTKTATGWHGLNYTVKQNRDGRARLQRVRENSFLAHGWNTN